MVTIEWTHTLAANAIFMLGATLQASTGLGAGLIIVPLLALISLNYIPAPVIAATIVLSFLMAWRGRTAIDFQGMPLLLIGIMAGIALGASLLAVLPLQQLGFVFGAFILLAVIASVSGIRLALKPLTASLAGALSGFMGATAAIGAPILALLYQHHPGASLRATLGFLYFVSSIAMLILLHLAGRFGVQEFWLGLSLLPGSIIGYLIAGRLSAYLDRGYSRFAVLAISSISALVLIGKSLS